MLVLLPGCFEEDTVSLSYLGVNHTDEWIVSFTINGEGGVMDVPAQGGGGGKVCCVTLPKQWRPGLTARIAWQYEGDWLRDKDGKEVVRDGKKVLVKAPWQEKTVAIAPYEAHDLEHFDVHFMPGGQVIAKPSYFYPWHKDYKPPYPHQREENSQ